MAIKIPGLATVMVDLKKGERLVNVQNLITLTEAGRLRGVSRDTIRRLIQRNSLRVETIDQERFVYRSDVMCVEISSQARVRRMSNEDILEAVLKVAHKLNRVPTSWEYSKYGSIHLSTLRERFGDWPKVRSAALKKFRAEVAKGADPLRVYPQTPTQIKQGCSPKTTKPRWIDVNDLIPKTKAGRLRKVSPQALNYLVRKGRLRCEIVCGKPFVFRSEVLVLKLRASLPVKYALKMGRQKRGALA